MNEPIRDLVLEIYDTITGHASARLAIDRLKMDVCVLNCQMKNLTAS